jgi:hypothetical protein
MAKNVIDTLDSYGSQNHGTFGQTIAIRRDSPNSDLDDLFGYSASDVETKSEVEVVGSNVLSDALNEFDELLDWYDGLDVIDSNIILSPPLIQTFIEISKKYSHRGSFITTAPRYLNTLIQNSYDAGHNDFKFEDDDFCNGLLSSVKGKEDNPLTATLVGRFTNVGFCSSYFNIFLKGNLGFSFTYANNVNLTMRGDILQGFASKSKDVITAIDGDVGTEIGRDSTNFEIYASGIIDDVFDENDVMFQWKNARNHQKYISMMQEFDRRMKE